MPSCTSRFADDDPDPDNGLELVAVDDASAQVVAILDASIDEDHRAAVIDTVVAHPDYRRRGLADALRTRGSR